MPKFIEIAPLVWESSQYRRQTWYKNKIIRVKTERPSSMYEIVSQKKKIIMVFWENSQLYNFCSRRPRYYQFLEESSSSSAAPKRYYDSVGVPDPDDNQRNKKGRFSRQSGGIHIAEPQMQPVELDLINRVGQEPGVTGVQQPPSLALTLAQSQPLQLSEHIQRIKYNKYGNFAQACCNMCTRRTQYYCAECAGKPSLRGTCFNNRHGVLLPRTF